MGRRRRALPAAALGGIPILASLTLVSQAARTAAWHTSLTGWEPPNVPALCLAA